VGVVRVADDVVAVPDLESGTASLGILAHWYPGVADRE
jgi:hypothetical protein